MNMMPRLLPVLVALGAGSVGCVQIGNEVVSVPSAQVAVDGSAACHGPDATVGQLRGPVYPVPTVARALPDFATLSPVGSICLDRLAVTERRTFPGLRDRFEWFGVDFQGAFVVAHPGIYNFRLTSDDGSKLIIDGVQVIDNDGYHVTRTVEATVRLEAGTHTIAVPFWQGPGPLALVLEMARPGTPYEVFHLDQTL